MKVRIDKTQQNSRCRLHDDRNETTNRIISECSKFAQREYSTRHDWVGKVIHWELCKKLKFEHMSKWYIHNPESFLENETQNSLGSSNLGQTTRPSDSQQKKKKKKKKKKKRKKRTSRIVDFAVPADHRVKQKESEKKDEYLDLAKKLKNDGT